VDLQGSGTKCWLQPRIAEAVGERAREPRSADCWAASGRLLGGYGQKAALTYEMQFYRLISLWFHS
jgi:hypothetical protein